MAHKNDNKQFLKIPRNWDNVSWQNRNLYVYYLWAKQNSKFGKLHISKLPKRTFHNFISKLISAGLMRREGEYFILLGNEAVWRLMRIKKGLYKGRKQFIYRKLPTYYTTWKEFKKKLTEDILTYQTERKKAQFRKVLSQRHSSFRANKNYIRPLFSSRGAAKLFGYKSDSSGNKYRNMFFDIVKEPTVRVAYHDHNGVKFYKFKCKRVYVNTIFHEC